MNGAAPPIVHTLSLCSGVAGLDLGVEIAIPGTRVVGYVEREAYAAAVLMARMEDSSLGAAPVWCGDLRSFPAAEFRGRVDLITAGYPCQPFSVAGKRKGADDERHLWPVVAQIIREVEPQFVFLENVGGHLRLGFDEVAAELRAMGYRVAATLVTAAEVGAPHGRERLFVLANHDGNGRSGTGLPGRQRVLDDGAELAEPVSARRSKAGQRCDLDAGREPQEGCRELADAKRPDIQVPATDAPDGTKGRIAASTGRELGNADIARANAHDEGCPPRDTARQPSRILPPFPPGPSDPAWGYVLDRFPELAPAVAHTASRKKGATRRGQATRGRPTEGQAPQSAVHRMADGMANRVDRLRCCGNGVVPLQSAYALVLLADALGVSAALDIDPEAHATVEPALTPMGGTTP